MPVYMWFFLSWVSLLLFFILFHHITQTCYLQEEKFSLLVRSTEHGCKLSPAIARPSHLWSPASHLWPSYLFARSPGGSALRLIILRATLSTEPVSNRASRWRAPHTNLLFFVMVLLSGTKGSTSTRIPFCVSRCTRIPLFGRLSHYRL